MARNLLAHISIAGAFAALFVFVALAIPQFADAQVSQLVPTGCSGPDCNYCHLAQLGQNILNLSLFLSAFVAAILFAYAGFLYLTAGGGSNISKAHGIFMNVAVGFILILAAWLIVDTVIKTLTGGKFGPWNEVCASGGSTGTTGSGSANLNTGDIIRQLQQY